MYSNNKEERLEKYDKLVDKINEIVGGRNKVMSQRKLAQLTGRTSAQICRWLKKEQGLNMEDAIKICQILNLNPSDYFDMYDNNLTYKEFFGLNSEILKIAEDTSLKLAEYNAIVSELTMDNLNKIYEYNNLISMLTEENREKLYQYIEYLLFLQNEEESAHKLVRKNNK